MRASGIRNFRYIAFPPVVFEAPSLAVEAEAVVLPEPTPGEPELVLAPENTLPAPPEPTLALAPVQSVAAAVAPPVASPAWTQTASGPPVAIPPPPASRQAMPVQAAPEPIPDPPSWSQAVPPPPARPPAGLRLLAEAAVAAAQPPPPSPKPSDSPRRFALLDDIQTEMRPRRARTGRRKPGDPL
jgi:hypothetical protein